MWPSIARSLLPLIFLQVASCNQSAPPVRQLAAEQTLRAVIGAEPRPGGVSLDPGQLSAPVETTIGYNLFDGLYRFDDQLHEQPDIAERMPDISADGLTYTFHLRHDVRFWTGASVTAKDVVYSWGRAAAMQGDWAFALSPVVGYDAVAARAAGASLTGLSSPDPYTVVARLSTPTAYWTIELGTLPSTWIVNRDTIEAGGVEQWWTNPDYLVGTGPFRLTRWITNSELDFTAVPNWWGGSTGALKRVEVHIDADANSLWNGYFDGRYDVLGFGQANLVLHQSDQFAASTKADPTLKAQIHTWPFANSQWLGFNLQSGPFSGYTDGTLLRRAFVQAIDRNKLAQAACQGGTVCVPATGGLIAKGLQGYLGDGADPTARFDPAGARATIKRLDPDGSRLRGLVFYYPLIANFDPSQAVAENLRAQWSANLGVDVTIRGLDPGSFFPAMTSGRFTMWRGGWEADYDSPQDWFDNLFVFSGGCEQGLCNNAGAIYDRPGYADMIRSADQQPLEKSLATYRKAGQMLVDDAALGALYYSVRTAILKPYVEGYGANALWEYRWKAISILQH